MNLIRGIGNRPATIQFGGNVHPVRNRAFVPPIPAPGPFAAAPREVNFLARPLLDDSEGVPPQMSNREESSQIQRRSRLPNESGEPTASFFRNSPGRNAAWGLRITEPQEAQLDGVMPMPEKLDVIGGNVRPGTPYPALDLN